MRQTLSALLSAFALLGASSCASIPKASLQGPRPNILFVLVDDLGYADFSVTGNEKVATPNIDRLAADGLLMTRFYVASPICSPSRAAFMTGRFPAEHRIVSFLDSRARNREMGNADWLDVSAPTLPRTLRATGYATAHVGKWHLGGGRDIGDAPLPTEYGFDESYTQFEGLGPRVLIASDTAGLASRSLALGRGPIDRAPKHELTERYVSKALDFVGRHAEQPWFVQLWLDDVHDPFEPSDAQIKAVRGKGRDAAEERFLAVLVNMDAQIGRLVAELDRRGELQDTLIVLTGDNGPTAAARYYKDGATPPGSVGPLRGRKSSLYEGGVREPLIVRWPGRVPPGRRDLVTVASAVDLYPTLADIVGAPGPADADGMSLRQAWTGKAQPRRPDLLFAYRGFGISGKSPQPFLERDRSPSFGIRAGDWKLLTDGDGSGAELYDIALDPGETKDLAASRPDVVRRLSARLLHWRRSLQP